MLGVCRYICKLQFLVIVLALVIGIYYTHIYEYLRDITIRFQKYDVEPFSSGENIEVLFTKEQLAKYNGNEKKTLYLGLLGSVYDVTKGKKHYGPGCAYHFFVGRDASVSFISGEFEKFIEDTADDVLTLKNNDLLSIENWKDFYNKEYLYKGKIIGRFYDANGTPTTYMRKYMALVEQAKESKAAQNEIRDLYPDCNIEWSADSGTRVWCTTSSGGKTRDWIGYPRKLVTSEDIDSFQCACIPENELDTTRLNIKPYDNCESLSHECFYKVD